VTRATASNFYSGPGNSELLQIIESQKREIKYLNEKVERIEKEKQDMIDNFKLSSSVLLERLKDLEAERSSMLGGERPQTANVLSKISKYRKGAHGSIIGAESQGRRIGQTKKQVNGGGAGVMKSKAKPYQPGPPRQEESKNVQ